MQSIEMRSTFQGAWRAGAATDDAGSAALADGTSVADAAARGALATGSALEPG
jgi:hypothetical protein